MLLFYIVSSLTAFCCVSSSSFGYDEKITIAKKFYEQRKVGSVTAFICWDNHALSFFRGLATAGIHVSIVHGYAATDKIKTAKNDNFYRSGVFVDASCDNARDFLETASRQKLFTILRHWLILDDSMSQSQPPSPMSVNETTTIEREPPGVSRSGQMTLSNVHMLPESKFTWCQRSEKLADTFLFFEIYTPCIGHPLETALVGEISVGENTKMRLLERDSATAERGDLKGAVLKAATVIMYPQQFTSMFDINTKTVDTWAKIHYPIAQYLAEQLNFSLEVTTVNDYGWSNGNGTFEGLIGLLQRYEIELTATGIFMRVDRMDHVEFTSDTYMIRAAIIFRQPSLSSVNNIFLLPFSSEVWLCCSSLCALTLAVLATQIFYSTATGHTDHTGKELSDDHEEGISMWDVVTYVFCIVCQQGFHKVPDALSARTTVFVVSLASLFLFTSFSANIVALLQTPSAAINNLVDIMNSPLQLHIEDVPYNKHYLQETTDTVTRQLIRRKLATGDDSFYLSAYDGMQRIRNGMHAFQVDTSAGYKVISETYAEREKCGLMEVELYPLPRFAMATVRGSPYKELLGQRLRWQREAGILNRLWKIWVTQKPICENSLVGFVSVGLVEFYPALAVLYYGVVASLLVFVGEILHFHRMKLLKLFVKPRCCRRRRRHHENEMKRAFNKVAVVPIESSTTRARRLPVPWAWTD